MTEYHPVTEVKIGLDFGATPLPVGRLAIQGRKIYFEYYPSFIRQNLNISPFHLPLRSGLFQFDPYPFEGLPGLFNDSLPDGWGRLLLDRLLRSQGINPLNITPLDRLTHIGMHGLGALVYEPDHSPAEESERLDLNYLADQSRNVLNGASDEVLQELLALNGSSAGARPKALIGLDDTKKEIICGLSDLPDRYTPWIVKFGTMQDGTEAGAIEYVYALMAREAGLVMPDSHLFPAQQNAGYFAVKRFDRTGRKRLHMHTACGLLHSDFRTPSLDYEQLFDLTGKLTRDARESEQLYRLAVFNVLAHNRDDHAKNFSFLMNENGKWTLSPAYDLTFSAGPGGEQSMTVMGEGRNPGIEHLIRLGKEAKIPKRHIQEIIEQTQTALSQWSFLAGQHNISVKTIKLIGKYINHK